MIVEVGWIGEAEVELSLLYAARDCVEALVVDLAVDRRQSGTFTSALAGMRFWCDELLDRRSMHARWADDGGREPEVFG